MSADSPQPLSKLAARQAARQRRAALSAADRALQSAAIRERVLSLPEMQAAKAVCVYVSFRDEVDTHDLVRSLLSSGKTATVPKLIAVSGERGRRIEACQLHRWDDLEPGAFGILEPRSNDIFAGPIDVCVAPGLAFTENGDRLGYGRGHYDEFLARHPEMVVVGLAFDCQVVAETPTHAHDRRVHMVITSHRTIRCWGP